MVCLGYFLTVSCEKTLIFLKKIINIFLKNIYLTGPNREFVYYCLIVPKSVKILGFGLFQHPASCKISKKLKEDHLETLKISKKVHKAKKGAGKVS